MRALQPHAEFHRDTMQDIVAAQFQTLMSSRNVFPRCENTLDPNLTRR